MTDREIMENLLQTEKGVCDLYLHGTIESAAQPVRAAFDRALNDSLTLQDQTYQKMSAKGWYATQPVEAQKIADVRSKFSNAN